MITAYATHPDFAKHQMPNSPHPERPQRIEAVWQALEAQGLRPMLSPVEITPADAEFLRQVHEQEHLDLLNWIAGQQRPVMIDGDTYALPQSYQIARLAAGAGIACVQAVLSGKASNGLAVVRPPGHHATPSTPMGFCLLNNIAIAARYAQQNHDIERVLIVDYDVHHGNGTQDIFYEDGTVLFISTHQSPLYPGTGSMHEIGRGSGHSKTINIPLPPLSGDGVYANACESIIWPAARAFAPQLILVSAGFDGHWMDPLAQMSLSLRGYDHLSRELIRMAKELCQGRIVFMLEGGYDLEVVSGGVSNLARALLGTDGPVDDLGASRRQEPDVSGLIQAIQQLHAP